MQSGGLFKLLVAAAIVGLVLWWWQSRPSTPVILVPSPDALLEPMSQAGSALKEAKAKTEAANAAYEKKVNEEAKEE